ncbi:MAG: hypothetical protein JJV88_00215 [Sulfurovum sp.]|nr:hypothetical protein [Sulfurovaceae bacterium]
MTIPFLKENIKVAIIVVLCIIILVITLREGKTYLTPKILPIKKELCTPQYFLKKDDVFKNENMRIINLENYQMTKKIIINGKEYKKYRQFGRVDRYFTEAKKVIKK